jgi:hypothetical protein
MTLGLAVVLMMAAALCTTPAGTHEGHDQGMAEHVCALMLVAIGAPVFMVILALGGEVAAAGSFALVAAPLSVLDPPPRSLSLSL